MNIRELISAIDRHQGLSEAKPRVKQDAQGNWVDAATGQPVQPTDNTVRFPNQAGTAPSAPTGTGDPTLDQPLPARNPNAPGIGQKVGSAIGKFGKAVGAVASVPQGLGRAIKKGYKSGVKGIGGPGAEQGSTGAAAPAAGAQQAAGQAGSNVDRELDDLRVLINKLGARMTAAGIRQ